MTLACFRVPMRSVATTVLVQGSGGPAAHPITGRRTKTVIAPRAPIVSAADRDAARARIEEMYPGAEVGEPQYLHESHRHMDAMSLRGSTLERAGFR